MMRGQALRPSQFILTYGVGAILEAPGGPRVIPRFDSYLWNDRLNSLKDYQIVEDNASAILKGGKIFRLPTNVDLDTVDSEIVYDTIRFPSWGLCLVHKKLYRMNQDDSTACTDCLPTLRLVNNRRPSARHEAIRFVRACNNGHLDDIDWYYQIHGAGSSCQNRVFRWEGGQNSLERVVISCDCGKSVTLKDVYNGSSTCSGRSVEDTSGSREQCSQEMKVALRSQSSLRIPVIVTAITIPPRDSNVYLLLKAMDIKKMLARRPANKWTKNDLLEELGEIRKNAPEEVEKQQIEDLSQVDEEEMLTAISQILSEGKDKEVKEEDVRAAELKELTKAAAEGAPPDPRKPMDHQFVVDKHKVKKVKTLSGLLRITPVERLRVVMAQSGYRRWSDDPSESRLVPTFLMQNGKTWYPGIELLGEGLFFDFVDNAEPKYGSSKDSWISTYRSTGFYSYHPTFVWWHTFAHSLLNVLSIDSGYSSAAIRERIYFEIEKKSNKARGGVLVYTSQTGGDGSLGGLMALAGNFTRPLAMLRARIRNCSNDPLCASQELTSERTSGASCYACTFSSETSCEHSNHFLDRNLLKGSI
jgi:hypothetical protein